MRVYECDRIHEYNFHLDYNHVQTMFKHLFIFCRRSVNVL